MHFLKEWPLASSIFTLILEINTIVRSNTLNFQKPKKNFVIIFLTIKGIIAFFETHFLIKFYIT